MYAVKDDTDDFKNDESGPRRSARLKRKKAARQASSTAGRTDTQQPNVATDKLCNTSLK